MSTAAELFPLLLMLLLLGRLAVGEDGTRVIELGRVIRPNALTTINATIFSAVTLDGGMRLKTNYITANLEKDNLTVIRYKDIIPFSAKGCMPVFYVAHNPPNVTRSTVEWIHFNEQWTVVLFANAVTSVDKHVVDLFARSIVIVGTFVGRGLASDVQAKFLQREIMVISNLEANSALGNKNGQFSGYMLLFELLTRYSTELPLLANLALVDHGKNTQRCARRPGRRLELLNHDFLGQIPIYPGIPLPRIFGDEIVSFPEHYGTHIDAPYHLYEEGFTTETLPEDRTFLPCIKVQAHNMTGSQLVGVNVFRDWEGKVGVQIPAHSYVFVDTGLSRKWPSPEEYLNINPVTKESRYPGIDPEAARWLVQSRRIFGIGIDTMSTDGTAGASKMATHMLLAKDDVVGVENVARIDRMPNLVTEPQTNPVSKCLFVHLRVEHGTGAPVAIFVHTEGLLSESDYDNMDPTARASPMQTNNKIVVVTTLTLAVTNLLKILCF